MPGTVAGLQERERVTENAPLQRGVASMTERVTHRVIDEDGARRLHLQREIARGRHQHGGDACFLDDSGDQTHGLVIERSSRYRDQDVYPVLAQLLDEAGPSVSSTARRL